MHISRLHLINFRNFSDQRFDFGPSFNILIGDNAQGKTNILEAISFLADNRSFRTGNWHDLVMTGQLFATIEARACHERGFDELSAMLGEPRKKIEKNGKGIAPGAGTGVGAVLFAPEEILLLKTQPAARRKFMDAFIGAMMPAHKKTVRSYEEVVSQRNAILADFDAPKGARLEMLEPWDEQLVMLGAKITAARKDWTKRINEEIPKHYLAIAAGDGAAEFKYEPHAKNVEECRDEKSIVSALKVCLNDRRDDELVRGTSLVGPHRDDFVAYIGVGQVKRFASQGQHRSFTLALKVSQMEIYKDVVGSAPILLLDDVASELDPERNRRFFEYVKDFKGQVFITTTSRDDIKIRGDLGVEKFHIIKGRAEKR